MPRTRTLVGLAALTLLVGGVVVAARARRERAPLPTHLGAPPNVVLIVLDTTRGDRCSVNGYEHPTTPALEALARDGVVYRDCWSPSPWTAPAHASLFTGLRPRHHGLVAGRNYMLSDEFDTLAEQLARAGYATGCFTANEFISPAFGLTQGFEVVERIYEQPLDTYPWAAAAHDRALDWALAERRRNRPFFVFMNDIEPHAPYTPPADVAAAFLGDATDTELAAATQVEFPRTLALNVGIERLQPRVLDVVSRLYDAEIATTDAAVGSTVERLRKEGILDETIVVVVGDHGENLGEHDLFEHMFSVHRTLLHVPLVIRYPPGLEGGTIVDDVVRLEDVHATLLELCGLPSARHSPTSDGRSLRAPTAGRIALGEHGVSDLVIRILQERFPQVDPRPYAVEHRSVYDGRHHLVTTSDGREELYDVRDDPLETHDISADEPEALARLRALLSR